MRTVEIERIWNIYHMSGQMRWMVGEDCRDRENMEYISHEWSDEVGGG